MSENEVGRGDLVAELRGALRLVEAGANPEVVLLPGTVRDLIAVLEALKPVVVDREQVAAAMHNHQMETHAWRRGCIVDVCIPIFLDRADAVLAALYPKATEGKS